MKANFFIAAVGTFFLTFVRLTTAPDTTASATAPVVRCFDCTKTNEDCLVGECTGSACTKSVGKQGETIVVNKGCMPGIAAGYQEVCSDSLQMGVEVRFCSCLTDFCNDSSQLRPLISLITAASIATNAVLLNTLLLC